MPDKRRKSREELTEELPSATPEEEAKSPEERAQTESDGEDGSRGAPEGDFEAVTASDREEVNELFRLIHSEGYLVTGTYSLTSDGEDSMVSLQVLLPTSANMPGAGEN